MAAAQRRIFISYRRQDTAWPARQLYEAMTTRFGPKNVFKDVDDINPGDDFVERITGAVAQCDVLLALIGPQWLGIQDAHGRRRIDDPDDFVRLEIAAALSRGIRVVPILIDGAPMPTAEQLPSDLAPLTRRHAVSIDPVSFNTDRLFATLSDSLSPRPEPPKPTRGVQTPGPGFTPARTEKPAPRPDAGKAGSDLASNRRGILIGAAALVVALIVGTLVWRPWAGGGSAAPSAPSTAAATTAAATSSPPSASPSQQVTEQPVLGGGPLAIMAHRGGQEKHQLQTLKAMEAAARDGFSIETDVRYTSDRVAVMVHDEEATKGLDCGGKDIRVGQTTWKVLKATCRSTPTSQDPVSYAIPTFAQTMEAISAASPTAWVFPEIKNNLTIAQTKEFLAVITNAGMRERTVLTSFTAARLKRVKQVDPEMPTLLMMIGKAVPVSQLEGMGLWGVGVDQAVVTPDYVKRLKAQNLKVMVWLLNDSRQWAAAKLWGADVVMTDFPAKYRAWEQEQ